MAMMISKFHKLIQSKVVWTAFAILISVAFVSVYTGSKNSASESRAQMASEAAGRLYGKDVSRAEFGRAYRSMYVIYSLRMGQPISVTDEIDEIISNAAWIRLATLKKTEELGLTVSPQQTIDMIRANPVFQNQQTGQFDKNIYDAVVANFLPSTGMSEKGFEQLMSENVLIEKASRVAAQGALVTEAEIKEAFHLYTDLLTVDYAAIPRSLVETPEVTAEDAKTYFAENQERFRMPEKAIVNFVEFPVTNYTASVEVTDEMVSIYYENNKQRFAKPNVEEGAEPEFLPLDEVKDQITDDIKMALARKAAANAADVFVAELADESTTFAAEAATAGLTVVNTTPAFTLTDSVKGVDPTAPFARSAFALEKNALNYYSDPVVGRDFVYVIELNKKLPSFLPSYEIVQQDAMESAKLAAAEVAYVNKAESLHQEIKDALKSGKTFADLSAQYQLELQTTEPFNITTTLESEYGQQIKSATSDLDAGSLAELIPGNDSYLIAYVSSKVPGDEAVELPAMRQGLSAAISNDKASRMVAEWQQSLLKEAAFVDLRNEPAADSES